MLKKIIAGFLILGFIQFPTMAACSTQRVEHICINKKAPVHTVTLTDRSAVIDKGNVIAVKYKARFYSKTAHAGDLVEFKIPDALYTEEGTQIFPANTTFTAEVTRIEHPKWFNKNARVSMRFRTITLPDCRVIDIDAMPFTKDGKLKEGPWMTTGKLFLSTVSFGIIGAGAGVGFAFIPTPAKLGAGFAIGIPVGCTVGLATGLITKGLHYRTKCGEEIYIIFETDTFVCK